MLRCYCYGMETKFAPYAPPAAVLGVIRHYRQRDVPERITVTNLMQIGVTESLVPRTVAALRFLGLLREDNTTTDQFRAIRFANEEDYQEVIGHVLDAAYKDVIDHIDVATATDREINNAFIPYSPGGQRPRMITLFLALAREAGWQVAASGQTKPTPSRTKETAPTKRRAKPDALPPPPPPPREPPPVTSGALLSVTDADMAVLSEADLEAVWDALGLVVKARARAARERSNQTAREGGEREGE